MAKILAITNQKGGVGKTTTSINLAASLVAMRRRVLLVDMDPQGNATMGSGIDKLELDANVNDVLLGDLSAKECIQTTASGYDILPANSDLTTAQVLLLNDERREYKLRDVLTEVDKDYDYIIIDSPPTLSMLTVNTLVAAHSVLIPMQCEYFALEGLSDLLHTIRRLQETANPALYVEGVVRTMYDPRSRLTNDVNKELRKFFGDKIYRTLISRNVRLAEAPSFGLPILQYDRHSNGAKAYLALAGEMIRREEAKTSTLTAEATAEMNNELTDVATIV